MFTYFCKKCGKEFFPNCQWEYKDNGTYYCSWKCFNHRNDDKPKKEVLVPKIGDTIKIKRIAFMPKYKGRVGVVKEIDFLGQLLGTWGSIVVIPGEDKFEIVEANDND